ncbi:ATP-dependent (S)-NAD(P)H-hydrate dehydratase [Schistocerca serialis cubense]|uniref:ATP-dependent (S)-NAD(P)H-hydrate dehydratase n=1 Tax=Schistocerca serialis cubense TaxID=2023355 RepID=UPI00214F32DE|nr:ATP-dependent (S)-NAD(P)H-hydrate dehydratase [Schistocerca serialis cubense]
MKKLCWVLKRSISINSCLNCQYRQIKNMANTEAVEAMKAAKAIVPSLRDDGHKGSSGRIGVVGGSLEYTGAPYFAAISAFRVGCDLSHVFCCKEAAPVIKSYSPDLIVHPVLDAPDAPDQVFPWLERLHVLVVGPGLGRNPKILDSTARIVEAWRSEKKPLVVDADGLFLAGKYPDILRNYPGILVVTPNVVEFPRLVKTFCETSGSEEDKTVQAKCLSQELGQFSAILQKGQEDTITSSEGCVWAVKAGGSPRRCGGQGDLLSGSLATFLYWASQTAPPEKAGLVAAYAACKLIRDCNSRAFAEKGRGAITSDMLHYIPAVFNCLFEK